MLPLILWSPFEQHPVSMLCPKCEPQVQCDSQLNAIDWCDGHSMHRQPRLIHCVHTNILLVSRVYRCKNGHEVLGHHPSIIARFATVGCPSLVPFRLYHRSDFTSTLISYVTSMVQCGCTFMQIEEMLLLNHARTYYEKKDFLAF